MTYSASATWWKRLMRLMGIEGLPPAILEGEPAPPSAGSLFGLDYLNVDIHAELLGPEKAPAQRANCR